MNKESISSEELNFLVRRNKEMELSQKLNSNFKNKIQRIIKNSLNVVSRHIETVLEKEVDIELQKYHIVEGKQSLATIYENHLYIASFNLKGCSGKHFLLTSNMQMEHFSKFIYSNRDKEQVLDSLSRGIDLFYESFTKQLGLEKEIDVENISVSSWNTEEDSDVIDLDALYEAKRYAIEYENQTLFIIHLSEVEFMEKLYEYLGDEVSEQQTTNQTLQSNVNVKKPLFCAFDEGETANANHNLELLYDVPLEISVVLGKTKRSIQEILEINTGKIIELNKYADDPLEIYCNGKLIAEGEVVVVDDNFGIKVTKLHQSGINKIR